MFEKLLKEQTDNTFIQLFRYCFTGSVAILADFYLLLVLIEFFKIHYLAAAAIAYLFGIVVNYILSTIWVFNKRPVENFWLEFGLFTAVGLIGLIFFEFFMWIFTDLANIYYLISKLIATVLVALWNFFARKSMLFS